MATLCEKCFHGDLCLNRCIMGEKDEKTLICCENFIPTADVVPKSEVERLEKEIKEIIAYVKQFEGYAPYCAEELKKKYTKENKNGNYT